MKKLLAVLLTVCMLVPMMAFLPAFAATPEQGFDFTDGDKWYYVDGTLADAPRTIEDIHEEVWQTVTELL